MYVSESLFLHSLKSVIVYSLKYCVKRNFARLLLHELRPEIIMDVGCSLNPEVDIGQIRTL